MTTFVVSSKHPKRIGIRQFQRIQVDQALDGKRSSVDIVSQKKVRCRGRVSTNLEELHEIIVLSMDVSANRHWRWNLKQVGLASKKISSIMNDSRRLVDGETPLFEKMILEELAIGEPVRKKHVAVTRLERSWGWYTWNRSFLGMYLGTVVCYVHAEISGIVLCA
jgi:hypothetical protein